MSRSMKIPWEERESKAKHFEEKYGVKWPFSEGWVLVLITKSSV